MRIVGGTLRGRNLTPFKGSRIRPTSDRVREAVFNVLAPHGPFETVLDLFSGTGALGIEALSRGSGRAVFVDNETASIAVIKKNLSLFGLTDRAEVQKRPVADFLRSVGTAREERASFDLIFIDPPYDKQALYEESLSLIVGSDILSPGGIVVIEAASKSAPLSVGEGLSLFKAKRYGDTAIYFFLKDEE